LVLGFIVAGALAGCRFGAYAGSLRGRGNATISEPNFLQDPNPPPGVKSDASFTLSTYELTSDVVYKHFVLLTSMGGGGMRVRARTPAAMMGAAPTLEETDDILDIWGGIGVGFQVIEDTDYHLAVFGLYTHSIFVLDDEPSLSNRFTGGVELGVGPHDKFGMVARLGLAHAAGNYANLDSERSGDLGGTAILLQLGGYLSITFGDD
jgi:hypothetical protein